MGRLTRETRWLRLSGIALVIASIAVFAYLEDTTDTRQLVLARDLDPLIRAGLAFVFVANLFAVGVVLLLAGLANLSLLTDQRARRGALTRLFGANVLVLCFAFVAVDDSRALDDSLYESWYALPLIVGFVVIARLGIVLLRSGWKHETLTAAEVRAIDPRPPVLYLRSFVADDQPLLTFAYTAAVSEEQEIAFAMDRIGPFIAIGKPGERLPELGAARLYVADDEWRSVVGEMMRDAALVVIRAGETPNLWWEIEETMKRCPRQRVIIVELGKPGSLRAFDERFAQTFGAPIANPQPERSKFVVALLRLLVPYARRLGRIIYFDADGTPREETLTYRLTWTGIVLSPYRPYRDSLRGALKAVFARLDLPWSAKRTLTTAVLLALFGGMLGLHHFYMGDRRRGWGYLAFCWLIIPMLLGWIDAVRLALLDEQEFRDRVGSSTHVDPRPPASYRG
jgi:TM2 domain-containing membrane protein YozV